MFAILTAIVILAVLPVAAALGAYAVADAHGCRLNEAGGNPCVVLGIDMGGMLAFLGLLGWLGIASLPLGAAGLLVWLVAALVIYIRRRGGGQPSKEAVR